MSRSAILAKSDARAGLVVSDQPVACSICWDDLPLSDGHTVTVGWSCRVACVDSPADRQLFVEHFAPGPAGEVTASHVEASIRDALLPMLRREVEPFAVDPLLSGVHDAVLATWIEAQVRKITFSAGLAILPPFRLTLTSPSRDRARRIDQLRSGLKSLGLEDEDRLQRLETLTSRLAGASGAHRASLLNDVRLSDPTDVLRAAALVDPAWSEPNPPLSIVAGTKVAWIDPSRPVLSSTDVVELDGVGPARSVRAGVRAGASLTLERVLLIGARDGVYVVDREARRTIQTLRHATQSEFGFNAATSLEAGRVVLATHSAVGLVRWDGDVAHVVQAGACRSVVAVDQSSASFVCDGRLAVVGPSGVSLFDTPATELSRVDDRFVVWHETGTVHLLTREELCRGRGGLKLHFDDASHAVGFDLAGIERAVVTMARGGLRLVDFAGAAPIELGSSAIVARSVRARPGYVAAVGVDRMRVSLLELARPETATHLNIAALLGSRVADVCFE
jgi:hypothetical protein